MTLVGKSGLKDSYCSFWYDELMLDLIKTFALSYSPPEPGCEYEFRPDPTWGEVPVGQICESNKQPYLITGVIIGIILIAAVAFFMLRRAKKKKLRK